VVLFNTSTLAHKGRWGASTPSEPGELVDKCATDPFIERYLDPSIGSADESRSVIIEAQRICFTDASSDWAKFHHHHRHIRFNPVRNGDELAAHIEQRWFSPLLTNKFMLDVDEDSTSDDTLFIYDEGTGYPSDKLQDRQTR
jgi:hypothetical protein